MGNVNAQYSTMGKMPIDTVFCVEKQTPDVKEFLNDKSEIFVASDVIISNKEQISNVEFIIISSNVEKKEAEIAKSKKKIKIASVNHRPSKKEINSQLCHVLENKILFYDSEHNFNGKVVLQNTVLPQNILGKHKVILIKQLSSLISFVSEYYIEPIITIQISENLYSKTLSIRPPPIS